MEGRPAPPPPPPGLEAESQIPTSTPPQEMTAWDQGLLRLRASTFHVGVLYGFGRGQQRGQGRLNEPARKASPAPHRSPGPRLHCVPTKLCRPNTVKLWLGQT